MSRWPSASKRVLALVCAMLPLAACATADAPTGVDLADALPDTSWRMSAFNDGPVPSLMTLEFATGSKVTGLAICNSFTGEIAIAGDAIVPNNVTQTALGCDLSGHSAAQASVRRLWAQPRIRASLREESLTLYEGRNRLQFTRDSGPNP